MKSQTPDPAAQRLAQLSGVEQTTFAVSLLAPVGRKETRRDTLRAALKVLASAPPPDAREPLVNLFTRFAANGGAHDYGCYIRGDALRALRPIVTAAELPLLEMAATTYEFPPPAFSEEAALLRSAALPLLAEVDENLARFHAVRLLVDPFTDRMSGEPAVTAARTLAIMGDTLPLYQFVHDAAHAGSHEVIAEALRGLRTIPPRLLPPLLDSLSRPLGERPGATRAASSPVPMSVRVGIIDLLLEHVDGPQQVNYLLAAAVAAALTRGQRDLLEQLVDAVCIEHRLDRRTLIADALAPAAQLPSVAALLAAWEIRRRR
ncbi:MAG: hypothetical protein ACRC1H_16050 [Caldilineaceae bacterium]